ncbi:protein phosphatase 2C domain-containing protein [Streptomyces violaceorubidus]
MSQQGGRPTGPTDPEDDWWGQLYDDSTDDTGPTAAPDSLDDRFASASGTVSRAPDPGTGEATRRPLPDAARPAPGQPWWPRTEPPAVPGPRTSASASASDDAKPDDNASPASARIPETEDPTPPGGAPPPPAHPSRPDQAPPGSAPPRPADPPRAGAWWEPSAGAPAGLVSPPPGWSGGASSGDGSSGRVPEGERCGVVPDAAVGRMSGAQGPGSGGRRPGGGPRGLTTSGTGPADLSEPPEADLPPRTLADLPPLPPPFLPSSDAPDGADRDDYVGTGPPTYDSEPTALPPADPDGLDGLVPDTVLEGARYGTCTLRAVSVRGDSARYRGEPRRDALLVARFGAGEQALVLVAMATGARATAGAHRAAAEVCRWIGRAVGRSHARLAEDLRAARRGDLKSGLHRLTDRSLGRLRAGAAEQGLAPDEYAATLRCLLLPADPGCRTRVFFGVGAGGLLRLRGGTWQDMEPDAGDVTGAPVLGFGSAPRGAFGGTPGGTRDDAPSQTPEGDRLTMDLGITTAPGPRDGPPAEPPREPFRFRASVARPGDVLLMCTAGLAEPLLSEPRLGELLVRRWAGRPAPGLGEFLADSGVRVKGYADDRTAAAVWEA